MLLDFLTYFDTFGVACSSVGCSSRVLKFEQGIVILVRDHESSITLNIYKYAYKLKAAVGSQSLHRLMDYHTLRIGRAISARVCSVRCVTGWRVAEAKAWNAFSCVIGLWHHRCHRPHDRTFFFQFSCLFRSVFLFFFYACDPGHKRKCLFYLQNLITGFLGWRLVAVWGKAYFIFKNSCVH